MKKIAAVVFFLLALTFMGQALRGYFCDDTSICMITEMNQGESGDECHDGEDDNEKIVSESRNPHLQDPSGIAFPIPSRQRLMTIAEETVAPPPKD